jgi:hypothetical protein
MAAATLDLITYATLVSEAYMKLSSPDAGLMGAFISMASARIEAECCRWFKIDDYTEQLNRWDTQRMIHLRAYPIVSVSEVKSAADWDFDSVTAIDSSDYDIDEENGILRFKPGILDSGARSLKVTYNGGLEATAAAVETNHPSLAVACYLIVDHIWRRRRDLGKKMESFKDIGSTTHEEVQIPKVARQMFESYRSVNALL